jgi:type III restriction enzyme
MFLSKFSVGENFTFPNDYPANVLYDGRYQFQKHYYSVIAVMNTEETECAQNIDINNNVEFWVRNLERQEYNAFWLQTSTDKFYPDFIVKLNNGKIVVIEYKGEHLYGSEDSIEKRTIGNYWALLTNNTVALLCSKVEIGID